MAAPIFDLWKTDFVMEWEGRLIKVNVKTMSEGSERLSRHAADRRCYQASFVSRGRDRLLRDRQLDYNHMDGAVGSGCPQNVGFMDTRLKTEKQNISTRF